MRIRVGHLYPDYLNIYADRGNIAVLTRRAALRGHELEVTGVSVGDTLHPGEHDLLYVGGGQDREQALIAPDLAAKGGAILEAAVGGAAVLAVCGGYQLLGRGYHDRHGGDLPGVGLFAHETVAGERRMIGDVLLECELEPGARQTLAGFENHAGRTRLDPGAEPLSALVPVRAGQLAEADLCERRVVHRRRTRVRAPMLGVALDATADVGVEGRRLAP